MNNNEKIIEIILDIVKNKFKNDVSLVCCYGSYANGTADEKSDVDFYFVPKTEKAWELANTFIVNGIGYDFWGISWERLEKIANFDDKFVSLLDGAKVLYSSSAEDEKRFNELKQHIEKIINSPLSADTLLKAHQHIIEAEKYYFSLISNNNSKSKKLNAGKILLTISDALCLMNNSFLKYGIKKHNEEISNLKNLPEQFSYFYRSIINAKKNDDIEKLCLIIILSAKKLYEDLNKNNESKKELEKCLRGLYEEISSSWNKLYKACDDKNPELAFLAGVNLQDELDNVLSECGLEQIDFLSRYDNTNLNAYKEAAKKAEAQFVLYLEENNIKINRYSSTEELEKALSEKYAHF